MKDTMKIVAKPARDIRVLLHDIRSVHNVGSMFRTSDAAGISHLYFCGYTPAPLDRFSRPRQDLAKVALGAEKSVAWSAEADSISLIKRLKKEGFKVIAVEQDARAADYKTVTLAPKTLLIFGNEVDGVSKELLSLCDMIAEIPMAGKKESLNVSVAYGIAIFRMLGI